MKEFDPTDPDYNLWLFLVQVRAAMLRARQKDLNRYGIRASQASVLFIINALGTNATPAELARWLAKNSSSIAGILNRMERQGLVTRIRDLPRKNQVRVALTEKGREAYGKVTERESMHRIMGSLSPTMHQQLIMCLEQIRKETLVYLGEQEMPFPY